MWRKGILFQVLVLSILLAGTAEAREAGTSGLLVLGNVTSGNTGGERSPLARLDLSANAHGSEGEAGSIINPDGVRSLGTTLFAVGRKDRGGLVHLAIDPHG